MSLSERQLAADVQMYTTWYNEYSNWWRCISITVFSLLVTWALFRLLWAHQCEFWYVSFLILILARYWMEQNTMGNVVYGTNSTTVHDSIALIFTPIKSGYWCFDRWSHKRKKENKNTSKALVVTLNNTCYPLCYEPVGFRNRFKRYFTIELK